MRFYYLQKERLVNNQIVVLTSGTSRIASTTLDSKFGIGSWIEYVGDYLPSSMGYDTTTNKIIIHSNDHPDGIKHLYAGMPLFSSFYGTHNLDPGNFIKRNNNVFNQPIHFSGNPALTYDYGSGFQTYKPDGTPVNSILQMINPDTLQVSPSNVDLYVGRDLKVERNTDIKGVLKVNKDVLVTGVEPNISLKNVYDRLVLLEDWRSKLKDLVPMGVISAFPSENIPFGWRLCDGSTLDRTIYDDFIKKFGIIKLPDLRGEFIRGWDAGTGKDLGRLIGSTQADAGRGVYGARVSVVQAHNYNSAESHDILMHDGSQPLYVAKGDGSITNSYSVLQLKLDSTKLWGPTHSTDGEDGEFRPRNVSLVYAMKVLDTSNYKLMTTDSMINITYNIAQGKFDKIGGTIENRLGVDNGSGNLNVRIEKMLRGFRVFNVRGPAGNDFAEFFPVDNVDAGVLIGLTGSGEYRPFMSGDMVIGVVSDNHQILVGDSTDSSPICLMGRVFVKCNGFINKGSYVVGDDDGCVRKFIKDKDNINDIVGIAVMDSENGYVKVLIR